MDLTSLGAAQTVFQLGDRILEIYKIKRDGSFYQQQEYAERLREREASVEAELAAAESAAADWRGLDIALASMSQKDRLHRFLSTNPFRLSPEDTRIIAQEASSGGSRPLILEAPIEVDDRASIFKGYKALDLGIAQNWSRSPCSEDAQPLVGAIDRPLKHQDLDVHLITRALVDIPAILIYGHIDADGYLWLSLCAWDIAVSSSAQAPMRLAFPRIVCTDDNESAQDTEGWKDEITVNVVTVIALLAQWFFLVRYRRKPTLNTLSELGHGEQTRALLARQLVAAYEVLASEGKSSSDLRLDQAELLADAGMHAQSTVFALSILDQIRDVSQNRTDYSILKRLAVLLETIGDRASAAEASALLETRSKTAVHSILGW